MTLPLRRRLQLRGEALREARADDGAAVEPLRLPGLLGGLALLAVELRGPAGTFVAVVPWASVPWRVSRRHVSGTLVQGRKMPEVVSRTVGREELAAWRVCGDCYLAGYAAAAATVRVEVAR